MSDNDASAPPSNGSMPSLGQIMQFSRYANQTVPGLQWQSDPHRTSSSGSASVRRPTRVDDTIACWCGCGETLHALGTGPHFIWARCHTREAAITARLRAHDEEQQAQHEEQARTVYARRVRQSGLGALNGMTLQTFHRSWLTPSPDGTHPLDVVTAWLRDVVDYGGSANYRDVHSPPACLFLHSGGKGRGKTHLAAALGWQALALGKPVAFIEELSYLRRRQSCPFEEIDALVDLPAGVAWLTIIDDLGQYTNPPPSTANYWYEVLNPRWLHGAWTIITSNHTPDELLRNGTIGDATYSRLQQMTGGYLVDVVGSDARLRSAEELAHGTD